MADATINTFEIDATVNTSEIDATVNTSEIIASVLSNGALNVNTRFPRGAVLVNPIGLSAANNGSYVIWLKCDVACTVTGVYGLRRGGTGALINARRTRAGVPSNFLASDLSLTSADTVFGSTTIQNSDVILNDIVEITLVSNTGLPTQIAVQISLSS